jgi:hypothetical protein
MKYIFALCFLLSAQFAQAQMSLLINGTRIATNAAILAARHKKAANANVVPVQADGSAAPAFGKGVASFSYQGQTVPLKRTASETFKGKGYPEIQALEAALEESHKGLLADSVQSFLPAAKREAIINAARKAAAARSDWNYAPYQQELAFYEKEEARRQQVVQPAPASSN